VLTDRFTFGVEEEYFLADAETLEVAISTPDALFAAASKATDGRVGREMLRSQIEVCTGPHHDVGEGRRELAQLRQAVAEAAARHGLVILAAGTHPTAIWSEAVQSPQPRYTDLMNGLQMIGQRNMLCGMHVHVELPDPDRRVRVMSRMVPYLPLLLALSTSSPFWQSRETGLKGYRLAAYDELPRTGLPEQFDSTADYEAYIDLLVRSGAIPDASHIWWAMRPSLRHPTLELRTPDCCTRLEDSLALASLYRALARHLFRNPDQRSELDVPRAIAIENKWIAQRHGIHGTFATETGGSTVAELTDHVIQMVAEDATDLGCVEEVMHCAVIARRGTSADVQLKIYHDHQPSAGAEAALRAVSQWIASETLRVAPALEPDSQAPTMIGGNIAGSDDELPALTMTDLARERTLRSLAAPAGAQ
jgi:carboxylate-amine ligase